MKLSPSSRQRLQGFTLIEILVVVAIIAILAALTTAGISSSQIKAKTAETRARIKLIEDALERYKIENGEYPTPSSDGTGKFFGHSFDTGGGSCLYQALTADGNDAIKGFRPHAGETAGPSNGEIGSSGGPVYLNELQGNQKTFFGKAESGTTYVLLDGFRQPFQYKPKDLKATTPDPELHNENFDLWSYGNLDSPKDDDESKAQWITNW